MKKDETCILCGNIAVLIHHISYLEDKTIPVCRKCHDKIHADKTHEYYPIDKYWHRSNNKCFPVSISVTAKIMSELHVINPENSPSQNVRDAIELYIKYKKETTENLYDTIKQLNETIIKYDKKINSINYQKKYEELIDKIINKLKISIEK